MQSCLHRQFSVSHGGAPRHAHIRPAPAIRNPLSRNLKVERCLVAGSARFGVNVLSIYRNNWSI